MRLLVLGLVLVGCRIGFDARPLDAGAGSDPSTCTATAVPPSAMIGGTLVAATNDDSGSCGGSGVAENVFSIDVPVDGASLIAASDQGGDLNTLLYVRSGCERTSPEIACDLDSGTGDSAADRISGLAAGRYYVTIDGDSGTTGSYLGSVQVLLPQGAACVDGDARDRCGPELRCANGTCVPAGCILQETLTGGTSYQRTIVTTGAPNEHAGTCGEGDDGGARGSEIIYQVVLASAVTNMHVSTNNAASDFDTLVYVRSDCEGVELACNDDSNMQNKFSDVDTGPITSGTYDVFIDGFATHSGTADVTITITP